MLGIVFRFGGAFGGNISILPKREGGSPADSGVFAADLLQGVAGIGFAVAVYTPTCCRDPDAGYNTAVCLLFSTHVGDDRLIIAIY